MGATQAGDSFLSPLDRILLLHPANSNFPPQKELDGYATLPNHFQAPIHIRRIRRMGTPTGRVDNQRVGSFIDWLRTLCGLFAPSQA